MAIDFSRLQRTLDRIRAAVGSGSLGTGSVCTVRPGAEPGPECPVCGADAMIPDGQGGWVCVAGCYYRSAGEDPVA
jgi:hypothetical protein